MTRFLPLLLLAAACAPVGDVDLANNAYPEQCRGDLSWIKTPVLEVSRPELEAMAVKNGVRLEEGKVLRGLHVSVLSNSVIYIDKGLMGWVREDVIRHERCHQAMLERTGSPVWHR